MIDRFPLWSFIVISLLLRALSFHYSVIDHDESTYLVISQQLLEGKSLYVDVWDTKPAGIFLIFAGILAFFGQSIVAVRLVAALAVAFTAYLLFRARLRLGAERPSALFSGVLYLVLISAYRFGMAVNTELFYSFMIMAGLWVFVRKSTVISYVLTGVCWGIGFIIKYVVLFDVSAILFAFFLYEMFILKNGMLIRTIGNYLLIGLGFLLPFFLCNLYFYYTGNYASFYEATFEVPGRYQSEVVLTEAMAFVFKFHLKFLPAMLLFYLAIRTGKGKDPAYRLHRLLPLCWFLIAWIPVILPGKYFDHYFAQLLLPVSWLAGEFLRKEGKTAGFLQRNRKWLTTSVAVLTVALIWGNQAYFYINEDTGRKVAAYLEPQLKEGEVIYAGKKMQVLYFLLDTDPPTKYVHPTLLTFASHVRTLRVDPDEEFDRILRQRPRFMAYAPPHPNRFFDEKVKEEYHVVQTYKKGVVVYERNEDQR